MPPELQKCVLNTKFLIVSGGRSGKPFFQTLSASEVFRHFTEPFEGFQIWCFINLDLGLNNLDLGISPFSELNSQSRLHIYSLNKHFVNTYYIHATVLGPVNNTTNSIALLFK